MTRGAIAMSLMLLAMLAACESFKVPTSMQDFNRLTQQTGETLRDAHGAVADISEPEEVELGRAVTAGVGARYRLMRDEGLTRYVALVGNAVAVRSDRPDMRYYFAVLDSDDVNAFAAPGGYIFITRGALNVMRDEAMLAGVLGHEVGHIALHHHAATIKNEKRKALLVKGGQHALQEGLARSKAAPFTQMIGLTADSVLDGVMVKGPSKAEETESDAAGFKYAASAGYDPAGLRDFLKVLQERGRTESAVKIFFSTHPGIDDRLREQETLLRTAASGGRRNIARFERAVLRRGPALATPAAITPPMTAAPRGAVASQFLQSITSSGRFVSHAISFEPGSDRLRAESKAAVKEIAEGLAATPTLRVRIEGHTDSQGNPMVNMQLSQRRADAVRSALVTEFGVDVRRVNTIGLGASRPIATNDTPEGRATNRRVEFVREP